jgi:hypothetical protein
VGDIIDIRSRQPHIAGRATCLGCRFKWVAVAEVGAVTLECPSCGLMKGAFAGTIVPDVVLECGCGNSLFFMTPEGPLCGNCGLTHLDVMGAGC